MTSPAPATPATALCGLWVDPDSGAVHVTRATPEGGRVHTTDTLRPFGWLRAPLPEPVAGVVAESVPGDGPYRVLAQAENLGAYEALLAAAKAAPDSGPADVVRPMESQYLLQRRARLYDGLPFARLRRAQLDIETSSADGTFSDAGKPEDRVLAVGLSCGGETTLLELAAPTDEAERDLLLALNAWFASADPDVVEGHNIFKFDLDYLRQRAKRLRVPCAWGRYGRPASFRSSRLKVAERWIDFPRCDLPGRAVVDTYLLVQLYDITTRELTSFGLKAVARYFGVTGAPADAMGDEDDDEATEAAPSSGDGAAQRTYIVGGEIQHVFHSERERFRAYLRDDLRETRGIADLLLPTYFEQARSFPTLLQEATLRGTTTKIDLLFLEEYYHARHACPVPPEVSSFEGGYTRSFREGVFRHVLHFDVASLYPSLLLSIGRNPVGDSLGVFLPMLTRLREYRLRYKQLARTAPSAEERAEAQARQSAFKILINSFYGYLGFSGARFGDGDLAAEVTRRGRELLQALIEAFDKLGCVVLEADTDGIYLASEQHWEKPERLLAAVAPILPPGIELEFDGRFPAMFCYKAKNYALYDGTRIVLRGSALRSRGIEPFLKELSSQLIHHLLGTGAPSPLERVAALRHAIAARELPVERVAKTEVLSQNPDAYERHIAGGGKPRRASAEAALQLTPRPRMGERVTYYLTAKSKGRTADWSRARPVQLYDAASAPYDPGTYLTKLDDWLERYGPFLAPGVGLEAAPSSILGADPVASQPPPPSADEAGQGMLF